MTAMLRYHSLEILLQGFSPVPMVAASPPRLNHTRTFGISLPVLTDTTRADYSSPWTMTIHSHASTDHPALHPISGTFSFGALKGCIKFDTTDDSASSTSDDDDEDNISVQEITPGLTFEDAPSQTHGPEAIHHHIFRTGTTLHFRWRGSDVVASARTYASEPPSPRQTTVSFLRPRYYTGGTGVASVARDPSWAGEGEVVFLEEGKLGLVFFGQGGRWEMDGGEIGGRGPVVGGMSVDGYGKSWYELFWLSNRCGDWSGDEDEGVDGKKSQTWDVVSFE